uniref:Si:ch211-191i18.2 n=1 Tax=Sinocyclocheilus grahami TaxID=75366 RepID=A0A672JVE6_SINGR
IQIILKKCIPVSTNILSVEDDQYNFDYDSTQTPEYDYNSTFEYSFFSNASSEELDKFLMGEGMDSGGETSFTEIKKETDGGVHEEKPTEPTIFDKDQVFLEPFRLYFLTHYNMLNTQNTHMCPSSQ